MFWFFIFDQVAKHIEACKAQVVFLAESCNEATYKKLIQAAWPAWHVSALWERSGTSGTSIEQTSQKRVA